MSYCTDGERSRLIAGLRDLAQFLESNPEIPAPVYSTVYVFPSDGGWPEMCADIEATAARMGVATRLTISGHYVATRDFGPVEYRAVAIPPKNGSTDKESE
jgi:hypothetical protein